MKEEIENLKSIIYDLIIELSKAESNAQALLDEKVDREQQISDISDLSGVSKISVNDNEVQLKRAWLMHTD